MNKQLKERLLWLAFAVLFLIVSSVSGYVITGLEQAKHSVHRLESENETNKVQWRKISQQNEKHWTDKDRQSYINGNVEGRLKCLEKR